MATLSNILAGAAAGFADPSYAGNILADKRRLRYLNIELPEEKRKILAGLFQEAGLDPKVANIMAEIPTYVQALEAKGYAPAAGDIGKLKGDVGKLGYESQRRFQEKSLSAGVPELQATDIARGLKLGIKSKGNTLRGITEESKLGGPEIAAAGRVKEAENILRKAKQLGDTLSTLEDLGAPEKEAENLVRGLEANIASRGLAAETAREMSRHQVPTVEAARALFSGLRDTTEAELNAQRSFQNLSQGFPQLASELDIQALKGEIQKLAEAEERKRAVEDILKTLPSAAKLAYYTGDLGRLFGNRALGYSLFGQELLGPSGGGEIKLSQEVLNALGQHMGSAQQVPRSIELDNISPEILSLFLYNMQNR